MTGDRVVSDLSRFEFDSPTPRRDSIQPTASEKVYDASSSFYYDELVSVKDEFIDPAPTRRRNMIEIAEDAMNHKRSGTYDYEDIYKYYEKQSIASEAGGYKDNFSPYPETPEPNNALGLGLATIPDAPRTVGPESLGMGTLGNTITNQTFFDQPGYQTGFQPNGQGFPNGPNGLQGQNYKNKELPPIMSPNEFYNQQHNSLDSVYKSNETSSLSSRQKRVENQLVKSVMNRPLFSIPASNLLKNDDYFENKEFTITANFIIYLFEMIIAIVIVSLSAVLSSKDHKISVGIYRYFIADSAISIIISLLFMSSIINFEKRNGSFYCTAAMVLSLVSFIITVSYIIPSDCSNKSICQLRKANSAFVIISFFLWLADLVMFLTTLYISRLNLLEDINFEYSNRGLGKEYNKSLGSDSTLHIDRNDLGVDGQPLKQYYLNERGEMYELTDEFDIRGKDKIIVYTV